MLSAMMDAATANRQMGYLSGPQFGRECGRALGSTPAKDVARLSEHVGGVADE
jgi:hypothetical protein